MPPTAPTPPHPFERALALSAVDEGAFGGRTEPAYANMVGPFGGITAAVLLKAVLGHPKCHGEVLALTVNFAAPVADGEFRIDVKPARLNRSSQHWTAELSQGGAVAATASAVIGARRETWAGTEAAFPDVPGAGSLPRSAMRRVAWTNCYDLRFARGGFPDFASGQAHPDSVTAVWMRDEPPRPLDAPSLAALADVFFPRLFLRRGRYSPAGTVTMTTYFHASAAELHAQGSRHVLGVAQAQRFGGGWFDQTAQVWGDDGVLLATTHQLVYFKE